MDEKIDEKDMVIIEVLQKHGDYTVRKIAKKTLLAPTTVHSRINKLRKAGVIRNYTINIDRKKLGMNVRAYILISADLKLLKEKHKTQYDLSEEIRTMPGIEQIDIVTGGTDMVAMACVREIEDLDRLLLTKIQLLDGVSKTQTMIIIH